MGNGISISWFFNRSFLLSRSMLWLLFLINFCGTVYGYIWYGQQLIDSAHTMPAWYLPFVPDSPTASLFFTLTLVYLLWDSYRYAAQDKILKSTDVTAGTAVRGFIEAFAFVTSIKYGIWAVAVIVADSYMGSPVVWQDWMLSISHLGMAAEVLLYGMFYRYGWRSLALVAAWTLMNDFMDYHRGTVPTLSHRMLQYIDIIEICTIGLSLTGIALAILYLFLRKSRKV